ncbi:MAG: hypothetical protein ACLUYK_06525, partial [Eggerthella lenta]
ASPALQKRIDTPTFGTLPLAGASSETRPGVSSSRCPQKSFPRRPNEVPTAKTSILLHIAVRPLLNQY